MVLDSSWPCCSLDTLLGFHCNCRQNSRGNMNLFLDLPLAVPCSLMYSFHFAGTHTCNCLAPLCQPFLQFDQQLLSHLSVWFLADSPIPRNRSAPRCIHHTLVGCRGTFLQSFWGSRYPEKYKYRYWLWQRTVLQKNTFEFPARAGPMYWTLQPPFLVHL